MNVVGSIRALTYSHLFVKTMQYVTMNPLLVYLLCIYPYCLLQSQSHVTTDGQSVSHSWCRAPSGTHDHIFSPIYMTISVFVLLGRPLWREGGCNLSKSLSYKNIYIVINSYSIIYIIQNDICTICTRPLSVQALWSRLCLILLSLCFDGS
jgi:hypothetical protein